jgi:hypothetical protein
MFVSCHGDLDEGCAVPPVGSLMLEFHKTCSENTTGDVLDCADGSQNICFIQSRDLHRHGVVDECSRRQLQARYESVSDTAERECF